MREGMKREIVDLRTAARKNSIYAFAAIKENNKSLHTAVSRQYLTPTHTPAAAALGGGGDLLKVWWGNASMYYHASQREPPEFTEKGIRCFC